MSSVLNQPRLAAGPAGPPAPPRCRAGTARRFARVFRSRPPVVSGGATIIVLLLAAALAPLISPYDPYEQDLSQVLQDASWSHWLGTDALGRDTLSRIIYGSRMALLIGIGTVALAVGLGSSLGLLAAYLGGWAFTVIMLLTARRLGAASSPRRSWAATAGWSTHPGLGRRLSQARRPVRPARCVGPRLPAPRLCAHRPALLGPR